MILSFFEIVLLDSMKKNRILFSVYPPLGLLQLTNGIVLFNFHRSKGNGRSKKFKRHQVRPACDHDRELYRRWSVSSERVELARNIFWNLMHEWKVSLLKSWNAVFFLFTISCQHDFFVTGGDACQRGNIKPVTWQQKTKVKLDFLAPSLDRHVFTLYFVSDNSMGR